MGVLLRGTGAGETGGGRGWAVEKARATPGNPAIELNKTRFFVLLPRDWSAYCSVRLYSA